MQAEFEAAFHFAFFGVELMGKVLGPVELLINVWRQWAGVRSAYERLSKLLDENPPRETGMPLPAPKGLVSVESVTAGPPGTRQAVLNNVSMKLEPGDVLAVVGPSGSGKSTLARLLVGVWAPQLGKVRLDGADLSQWNKDLLGPHLGYLPQDIELFAGTVAQNISRFGQADSAAVIAAAHLEAGVRMGALVTFNVVAFSLVEIPLLAYLIAPQRTRAARKLRWHSLRFP